MFSDYLNEESDYSDLLEDSPKEAVLMLDDPDVEIDNNEEKIVLPESYSDSGIEAFLNNPARTVKKNVEEQVQNAYRQVQSVNPLETPFYRAGKNKVEDHENDEELRFQIWDTDDDHRKSAYGATAGITGLGASVASQKEETAAAFGIATAGITAFNSYSRGRRDDMIEEAIEGLSEAYGDYDIEFKEDDRRSERMKRKAEWVKETLGQLN